MQRILYTPLSREFLLNRGYCCEVAKLLYNYKRELHKEEIMRPEPRVPQKELEDNIKISLYDLEDMSMKPYNDGVCEGEYVRPTQAEIIEHNRKHCRDFIGLSNYTEKMTLVSENLLEKLKDFNYWKEWKNK